MKFTDWLVLENRDLDGLLQAVVDNPFDDESWLVLADSLGDHGDPLSELIRLAIGLHDHSQEPQSLDNRFHFGTMAQRLRDQGNFGNVDFLSWDRGFEFDYQTPRMKKKIRAILRIYNHALMVNVRGKWQQILVRQLPKQIKRAVIFAMVMDIEESTVASHGVPRLEDPRKFGDFYASKEIGNHARQIYSFVQSLTLGHNRKMMANNLIRALDSLEALLGKRSHEKEPNGVRSLTYSHHMMTQAGECNHHPDICGRLQKIVEKLGGKITTGEV